MISTVQGGMNIQAEHRSRPTRRRVDRAAAHIAQYLHTAHSRHNDMVVEVLCQGVQLGA